MPCSIHNVRALHHGSAVELRVVCPVRGSVDHVPLRRFLSAHGRRRDKLTHVLADLLPHVVRINLYASALLAILFLVHICRVSSGHLVLVLGGADHSSSADHAAHWLA